MTVIGLKYQLILVLDFMKKFDAIVYMLLFKIDYKKGCAVKVKMLMSILTHKWSKIRNKIISKADSHIIQMGYYVQMHISLHRSCNDHDDVKSNSTCHAEGLVMLS